MAMGWETGVQFHAGECIFLLATWSREAMGPTQSPVQLEQLSLSPDIKQPERQTDHWTPCSAEVKVARNFTYTPPFMSWCLIKQWILPALLHYSRCVPIRTVIVHLCSKIKAIGAVRNNVKNDKKSVSLKWIYRIIDGRPSCSWTDYCYILVWSSFCIVVTHAVQHSYSASYCFLLIVSYRADVWRPCYNCDYGESVTKHLN